MAAENKDIEKDIDIEEGKEDNTADEAGSASAALYARKSSGGCKR